MLRLWKIPWNTLQYKYPILLDPTDDDENSGNLLILCLRHLSFFAVFQPSQLVCPISSPADGIPMDRQTPRMICEHTYIIYIYIYTCSYTVIHTLLIKLTIHQIFTQIPDSLFFWGIHPHESYIYSTYCCSSAVIHPRVIDSISSMRWRGGTSKMRE